MSLNPISDPFHAMIPPEFRTETPVTAEAFVRMQCDWYNNSEGKMTGLDCKECKNRGYFQILMPDGNTALRECKCMAERQYIAEMQRAGLGDLYSSCTFTSYEAKSDWQKTCKALAWRYANTEGNGWLLFSGQSGTGKTHLCTAVCSVLARAGRHICYLRWTDLFGKLERTRYDDGRREDIMRAIRSADVLYIDDFMKTPKNREPSQQVIDAALSIIDIRYTTDRKTILSTEFLLEELLQFDEALGGRISEKAKGSKIIVKREQGRNYRTGVSK